MQARRPAGQKFDQRSLDGQSHHRPIGPNPPEKPGFGLFLASSPASSRATPRVQVVDRHRPGGPHRCTTCRCGDRRRTARYQRRFKRNVAIGDRIKLRRRDGQTLCDRAKRILRLPGYLAPDDRPHLTQRVLPLATSLNKTSHNNNNEKSWRTALLSIVTAKGNRG